MRKRKKAAQAQICGASQSARSRSRMLEKITLILTDLVNNNPNIMPTKACSEIVKLMEHTESNWPMDYPPDNVVKAKFSALKIARRWKQ